MNEELEEHKAAISALWLGGTLYPRVMLRGNGILKWVLCVSSLRMEERHPESRSGIGNKKRQGSGVVPIYTYSSIYILIRQGHGMGSLMSRGQRVSVLSFRKLW